MTVIRCVIVVDRSDSGWLSGEVRVEGRPSLPFVGWIGLLSALEAAIAKR
jgi:hypothetical protein